MIEHFKNDDFVMGSKSFSEAADDIVAAIQNNECSKVQIAKLWAVLNGCKIREIDSTIPGKFVFVKRSN